MDQRLLEGLRRGEAAAVEAMVGRYGRRIYRTASRILRDSRDAEEITQDVLLTVVRRISTFRGDAAFSTWLYRITANAAYERARARRARAEVSLDLRQPLLDAEGRYLEPVSDRSRQLDDPAVAVEVRSVLAAAIGRLPEEYRTVVVLRDVEGLTNEDVAAALQLSAAAVKSRLHRARLVLRRRLAHLLAPVR